ncbi:MULTISPECIES: anaerobic sulfatase maturase [Clostridium]|uniref:anaerobic sulfatase maturase n=1 Tax=Clostridium TaxID=1485 RepID=UPI0008251401|nr:MULTISPECIES: anaerobic sulfatase maturase [Clostridium]PJI07330.1 anaerobic sulfatase maturase [Clostridium sp. CT7]
MLAINLLIKPASGNCNLKCKYCFYKDVTENRKEKNYGIMSHKTLEMLVKRAFEYANNIVGFAFQGGEPTLAGLDFYKNLITLQKKYNVKKIRVNNAIQTNGMVIDDEWAKFLAKNKFLVGLSLDGPKEIHDQNRMNVNGIGSYKRIEKTIESFNKYKVQYNILSVISKSVARHVEKIYKFFSKNNFKYLQFIPCLDKLGTEAGNNEYSLTPKAYGDFLKKLFDLWYTDLKSGKRISIRMFDNILQILLGMHTESCDMSGYCSANLVIEADGSCYPCDFYAFDTWNMGNITESSIKELLQGDKVKKFVNLGSGIPNDCRKCEFAYICRGGCRRYYEPADAKALGKNYFCSSYKDFYQYTILRFQELTNIVRKYRVASD